MLQTSKIQGLHPIGVDVSKQQLDCDGGPLGCWRVANSAEGIKSLFAKLPQGAHLFCESTGGYESRLRQSAQMAGIAITTLNPWRVRRFAESAGYLAKTDRIDAHVIREFGWRMHSRPDDRVPKAISELISLATARDQLVKATTQLGHGLEHQSCVAARQALQKVQRSVQKQIERVEEKMRHIIAKNPLLTKRFELLVAQYGIGETIATTLLTLLPELGRVSRQKIAALAGVAPYANDSGKRSGERHIRGGRDRVRRALYLATLTAVRKPGSILNTFYTRLTKIEKKPCKVALIAAARKFLSYLNSQIAKLNLPPLLDPVPAAA